MHYFDCNVMIGPNTMGLGEPELTIPGLLEEMDHAGIESALVTHFVAKEFSPRKGNARLLDELALLETAGRLFPCAIWCPLEEGYGEDPAAKARELRQAGFLAVRAYPREFNFVLDPRIMGRHLSALAEVSLPLLVDAGQIAWSDLVNILDAFPKLKIVLTGDMYRNGRIVVPLLRTYGNLYFETCGFETHRGVEELVVAVGYRRLLFGSRMPAFAAGASKMMIDLAFLTDEQRSRIAGENLAELLQVSLR